VILNTTIRFVSESIPGSDYTRLKPCTYWAEQELNNNNNTYKAAYVNNANKFYIYQIKKTYITLPGL